MYNTRTKALQFQEDIGFSYLWLERLSNFSRSKAMQGCVRARVPPLDRFPIKPAFCSVRAGATDANFRALCAREGVRKVQKNCSGGSLLLAEIMIVDDNPANLKVLGEMLTLQGYEVRAFPRGRLALAAALRKPPDLVLLDINMPEMNGFEVCEQFKANDVVSSIPIIVLSALDETEAKVRAFQAGAVDYVSKPFQFEEIRVRVDTHLKMHWLRQELERQNERLEAAVAARTRELTEANARLTILDRSKSDFLSLISHELRTPLNGLLGIGEIMFMDLPPNAETEELRAAFTGAGNRFLAILEDALFLTEIDVSGERFRSVPTSLRTVLTKALARCAEAQPSRQIRLQPLDADLGMVMGDERLLERAFGGLLNAAVQLSAPTTVVHVHCEQAPGQCRVVIACRGRILSGGELASFFEIFSARESLTAEWDLGLGPPVASRILSLFGAAVTIESSDSLGTRMMVTLVGADQDL